ncbi:MupG family TIM beta-alpha barrel fold protein [Atopococcus tabaci]|uniref:MupG family TIM beta-alpha barrel fold protein n=1 Tax=Atopococcus tabaci TaxID=269774 RepID=UPI00040EEDB7|nr:MupG family TIM beta-alpha barrel fold protein [Atopococcus tabaci]
MLGASLYLSQGTEKNKHLLKEMKEAGIRKVFTSLHIPEDDPSQTLDVLREVTRLMKDWEMELMVDVSSNTASQYGLEKDALSDFLTQQGVGVIRLDFGFSMEDIKELAGRFHLVLNASTIDEAYCNELEQAGIDLSQVTVCHNYYPRENTGLDHQFFLERNRYLKEKGFSVMAFIAGDGEKRGPVYAGLPTLEEHRDMDPLEAYLDLMRHCLVDEVFIGDISLAPSSMRRLMKWVTERIIQLPVEVVDEEVLPENFYAVHANRPDVAADVVRASESRLTLQDQVIQPKYCTERPVGCVTIDNVRYGRYAGEIQITKKMLPQDDRVNVLAHLKEGTVGLLNYIGPDDKFQFYVE